MGDFSAEPPQGHEDGQQILTEGRSHPLILPPQGLASGIPVSQGFLLDLFPNAQVAYSLRQLRTLYTGPAIRVRRSSDNTQMDVEFLPDGNLDIATLVSFVGSSDGEIFILYDQSGNNLDLDTQFIPSSLPPRIIISGVLQTRNSLPTLKFIDTDILQTSLLLPSPASSIFIFNMMGITSFNNPINANLNTPITGIGEVSYRMFTDNGKIQWSAGNTGTEQLQSPTGFGDFLQHLLTLTKIAGLNNQKIILDETEIAQMTPVVSSTVLSKLIIGNSSEGGANGTFMNFQEFVFYNTDQSANLSEIQNDILSYWKYNPLITADGDNIITADGRKIVAV